MQLTARMKKFKHWLESRGAEILPITNEYEVVRFRCKHGVGVVYQGKRGHAFSGQVADDAYDCYRNGKVWDGKFEKEKRSNITGKRKQLLQRDGDICFYCGVKMTEDDMTIEHILSLAHQGPDRLENMALCHAECNTLANNMPVIAKMQLRDNLRSEGRQ